MDSSTQAVWGEGGQPFHQLPGHVADHMAINANHRSKGDVAYAIAVLIAIMKDPAAVAPWCTTRCPECGEDFKLDCELNDLGWPSLLHGLLEHLMVGNLVVVGCQGFWVINPNAVGIPDRTWQDWVLPPE